MKREAVRMFSLDDKTAIITGGNGFLGRQYAKILSMAGAKVFSWDINFAKGKRVDITSEEDVRLALEGILNFKGRIDILINNAAMNPVVGSEDSKAQFEPYESYPIDLWRRELEVNLTGMMICTKAVAPIMMNQKNGSIVNIASEVSNIAHDHRVYDDPGKYKSIAYTTTKTAVLGFTRQWAARLGEYNVRVNTFSPGGVRSEKVPEAFAKRFGGNNMLGRMAESGEYNGAILFLCSDASSFMTGANLTMDGGKSAW